MRPNHVAELTERKTSWEVEEYLYREIPAYKDLWARRSGVFTEEWINDVAVLASRTLDCLEATDGH